MADGTKIEWADATVNAINGCSVVSPGCTNCYAMRLAGTRLRGHPSRAGLTQPSKAGPVWNGEVRLSESALMQPLHWRAPRVIFWNAHGDTFHDAVPDDWIDRMFAVMALTPQHKHLVLTKRSARMRDYVTALHRLSRNLGRCAYDLVLEHEARLHGDVRETFPARAAGRRQEALDALEAGLPNVWLGVSVEDQARADERIPDLLATPAAGRFLSCEPLLGPVDLSQLQQGLPVNAWLTWLDGLDGVIVGGESGPGSRPMHPDWALDIRDACDEAGVDFHFKQWGDWAPGENALKGQTRTEQCASWWDGRWDYSTLTVKQGEELHRDDEPDLYRFGKKGAGRHLDGELRDALPWRAKEPAQSNTLGR